MIEVRGNYVHSGDVMGFWYMPEKLLKLRIGKVYLVLYPEEAEWLAASMSSVELSFFFQHPRGRHRDQATMDVYHHEGGDDDHTLRIGAVSFAVNPDQQRGIREVVDHMLDNDTLAELAWLDERMRAHISAIEEDLRVVPWPGWDAATAAFGAIRS